MVGAAVGMLPTPAILTEEALLRAEFLAEDELIEINPMVRTSLITLMRGSYGPFEPSITTVVPLWLALALKKVQRCKILPPPWLTAPSIEAVIGRERGDKDALEEIHFYFWEISSLLLHHASDDVDGGALRRVIEDLSNIRSAKLRLWLHRFIQDRVNAIKLNNLCLHEIELHRPMLTRVLGDLYAIHIPNPNAANTTTMSSGLRTSATPSATAPSTTPSNSAATVTPTPTAATAVRSGRALRRIIKRT